MDHLAQKPIVTRGIIVGAGCLMLFTTAIAGFAHSTGRNHVAMPPTAVVQTRDLLFADRRDGGVDISDASTGRHISTVVPETGGFLRGIMRGLVREHRLNDQAVGTAFRLTRWADGRLSIADPTTRESFDLEAFGSTNEAVFARLLEDRPQVSDASPTTGADAR